MRAFLSYDLTEPSVLSKISRFQDELKSMGADLKIVKPDIMHFTVRFLGEINEAQRDQVVSSLKGKVESSPGRAVIFRGIGTFPSEKRISVIWIGCDETSGKFLNEEAKMINEALGSKVENLSKPAKDSFSPHLTIARVKSARNKDRLVEFITSHKNDEFGSVKLGHLKLKLSELSPSGPSYSDLHVFE